MKKLLLATTALLALSTAGNAAATIDLGAGDPGTVTTLASGGGQASVSGAISGNFSIDLTGTGSPPLTGGVLLDGNTITVRDVTGAGSVNVWVSSTGNTSPTGLQSLESSFTQNLLTAGWTVTAFTYADNTNTAFGTQQLLATTLFTASDQPDVISVNSAALGAGPFSLSERWLISAPGQGQTNNTTDISAVPGPIVGAGIPGLMAAFSFFGLNRLRRRKLAA